jgi:AcrR family transcriptional regulator
MTPHPRKEGREPLTRDKILDQAVDIIDEHGVEGLTMRRLADAFDIEPMSLYHHFANKDAILDGVVERIVAETTSEPPPAADADWKAVMMSGPASARRALDAHPKAGLLFFGRQYRTAPSLQMLEAPLRILYGAGFRGQELVDAAHAIFAFIAGWFILASGEGGSWSGPDDEDIAAAPEAAPIAASVSAELREWGRGFDEGLLALLEGLEARRSDAC